MNNEYVGMQTNAQAPPIATENGNLTSTSGGHMHLSPILESVECVCQWLCSASPIVM